MILLDNGYFRGVLRDTSMFGRCGRRLAGGLVLLMFRRCEIRFIGGLGAVGRGGRASHVDNMGRNSLKSFEMRSWEYGRPGEGHWEYGRIGSKLNTWLPYKLL